MIFILFCFVSSMFQRGKKRQLYVTEATPTLNGRRATPRHRGVMDRSGTPWWDCSVVIWTVCVATVSSSD